MRRQDDAWVLDGGRKSQVLGGAFARDHLGALLQACDGTRTLDEIGEVTGHQMLAELMVGKSVELSIQKEERTPGGVVLEVEGLCAKDAKGIEKLKDVSLQIREGEIVGIAGVDGNGQHELVECLAGLHRMDRGTMRIGGNILQISGLSFIGLGVQPPTSEWGSIMSAGQEFITTFWPMITFPGIAILLTVFAFNVMGDGLRDALDPRLKQ